MYIRKALQSSSFYFAVVQLYNMRKIAINGFGRIGRLLFRQLCEKNEFQIVAINDLGDIENLAYLLQHDTVYGRFEAGAKRVVITAPATDEDTEDAKTVLVGVNEDELSRIVISSNGSCTTNAASPVVEVLRENPGIKKAVLNTVHGYTATQNLVDGPTRGKDFRRGRAAGQNIVPSSTGAAVSVTRVVKELQGKFDGIALRVPV